MDASRKETLEKGEIHSRHPPASSHRSRRATQPSSGIANSPKPTPKGRAEDEPNRPPSGSYFAVKTDRASTVQAVRTWASSRLEWVLLAACALSCAIRPYTWPVMARPLPPASKWHHAGLWAIQCQMVAVVMSVVMSVVLVGKGWAFQGSIRLGTQEGGECTLSTFWVALRVLRLSVLVTMAVAAIL
ncbi:hypothetical protein VTI74DRAFT_7138 [Chaetomium olivicolor]